MTDPTPAPHFSGKFSWAGARLPVLASVVFLTLAGAYAWTRMPICDEAFYASPGRQLLETGGMGSPLLESPGVPKLLRIEQRTYWTMPGMTIAQAAWYSVAGESLHALRSISVIAGLVCLLGWAFLYRELSATPRAAMLATLLLALDFPLLNAASIGRADALALAMTALSLAAYAALRRRNLFLALFLSNLFAALAGMIHPIGGLGSVTGLAVLFLTLDRGKLLPRHALAIALPYLAIGAAWWSYTQQDPAAFRAQFYGNVAERHNVTLAERFEVEGMRYLAAFGVSPDANRAHRVRIIQLVIYLGAAGFILWQWRRRRLRLPLYLWAAWQLVMTIAGPSEQSWYWVLLSPASAWCGGYLFDWLWERFGVRPAAAAFGLFAMATCVSIGGSVYLRHYQNRYLPLVAYLNSHVRPGELIMGAGEVAFGAGFQNFNDDREFGLVSGKQPDWIVLGDTDLLAASAFNRRGADHLKDLLDHNFEQVHLERPYVVWHRVQH